MERFEQHMADATVGMVLDESPEFLETEFPEGETPVVEESSTDDPVRVYLREMGSIRLLTRQGEIDLARRMERGQTRARKAISRSPLVWRRARALYEQVRTDELKLAELVELGPNEETAARKSDEALRRLARFARAYSAVLHQQRKIVATPSRHIKVRAALISKRRRLQVACSREFRVIPFTSERWNEFRGA